MSEIKNNTPVRVTISLPEEICRHIDGERLKTRVLRSHWIREAILEKLGRVERENLKFAEMEREIEKLKRMIGKE